MKIPILKTTAGLPIVKLDLQSRLFYLNHNDPIQLDILNGMHGYIAKQWKKHPKRYLVELFCKDMISLDLFKILYED